MAKKTEIEGYSVIVFVPTGRFTNASNGRNVDISPTEALEIAVLLKKKIADKVAGIWSNIDIEPQISATCESCGSEWTEESDTYNLGCCTADEEDEEQRKRDNGQLGVGA